MLDAHPDILCGPELTLYAHPFVWRQTENSWRERMLCYLDPTLNPQASPEWTLEGGVCPWVGFLDAGNLAWYGTSLEEVRNLTSVCRDGWELSQRMFQAAIQRDRKRVWAEKSPPNLYAISAFLDAHSEARAIVIVRDGRDVVCSLRKRSFSFAESVAIWLIEAAASLELAARPNVHLLHYEDLVHKPVATLDRLLKVLELPAATEQMIEYRQNSHRVGDDPSLRVATWTSTPRDAIDPRSVGRWQRELSPEENFLFRHFALTAPVPGLVERNVGMTCDDLLRTLGYAATPSQAINWQVVGEIVGSGEFRPARFHGRYVHPALPPASAELTAPQLVEAVLKARRAAMAESGDGFTPQLAELRQLAARANDHVRDRTRRWEAAVERLQAADSQNHELRTRQQQLETELEGARAHCRHLEAQLKAASEIVVDLQERMRAANDLLGKRSGLRGASREFVRCLWKGNAVESGALTDQRRVA
jgi:hypothetical protein